MKSNSKIKEIAILILSPLIGASAAWEYKILGADVFKGALVGAIFGICGYIFLKKSK